MQFNFCRFHACVCVGVHIRFVVIEILEIFNERVKKTACLNRDRLRFMNLEPDHVLQRQTTCVVFIEERE